MQKIPKGEIDKLIQKYTAKLEKNISRDVEQPKNNDFSREYGKFRKEAMSNNLTRYERLAKFAGKIINTKPNDKILPKLRESLEITHLNLTVNDVSSFAIFYPLLFGIFAILLGGVAYLFDQVGLALFLGLVFLVSLLLINLNMTLVCIN